MYISELKLHGFKSFAKKEVMKLGQGVTTVVGPNGCGKTNIVDAIRWVLGEQKYSILRSGKMEDVIFNGAENIKPLGVCEVSLTVHNNRGKLPVEYNDIEIARRIYRSGESEYFLNRTPCRLKDINDLFVDTGMGADAYSVIELKMIEQILSDTGDDRRRMFEEAAGINKYRHQRKRTLRRFEATRVDLERISDIIAEVEQKVRTLELQLKRFKRHATLNEDLEENDLALAYLQVFRYRSLIAPLEKKIKEFKHLRESKSTESSIHEKELNQFRDTYRVQEKELNELQINMTELNENREAIRNKILVWTEQGRGALLTVDRLNRESQNNCKKIGDLNQLSLDFDKEMSELEPNINALLETYKKEKDIFEKLESNYRQLVENLDHAQDARWELQRRQTEDRTLFDRTQALVEEKKSAILELQNVLEVTKENKSLQGKELQRLEKEQKHIRRELTAASDALSSHEKGMKISIDERDVILEERHFTAGQLQILDGQLAFYNELVETKEGFPEGTRYILENPQDFPGVLGTVADMFQIEPDFRDALEAGLGDLSHCLIAKDK
ncbi:MAG: AAA family ATPase, partial [Candidatus Neomarinimicrobiota bacterium]|nr:AAA family ATPase [Candidatus Neomarinimicrobiota bacterium]